MEALACDKDSTGCSQPRIFFETVSVWCAVGLCWVNVGASMEKGSFGRARWCG